MKLSHEKIVHLSHVVADALNEDGSVTFVEPHNKVRLEVLEVLRREIALEEEMENRARARITSMKRDIVEGSPEWEILYRKYYEEELEKRRSVR
ncbi:MAG: DUF507 family protein [Acidobacteriota bacterium]|jgi:hypothetical protein